MDYLAAWLLVQKSAKLWVSYSLSDVFQIFLLFLLRWHIFARWYLFVIYAEKILAKFAKIAKILKI